MSKKRKPLTRDQMKEIKEKDEYLAAVNSMAQDLDLKERFDKPYEHDVSIDYMYQRKKRKTKSKNKRAKKGCGCK